MFVGAFMAGYYSGRLQSGARITVWAEPAYFENLLAKGADLAPNERWVTLKPHGPDHPSYVHVKIRENPDGTAHVLNGPGELRGLRLTRRPASEKREAKAGKPPRDETPEQKQKRVEAEKAIERRMKEVQKEAISAAAALTNDKTFERLLDDNLKDAIKAKAAAGIPAGDPAAAKQAAGMAAANRVRSVATAVNRLTRHVIANLVQDDDLRAAVLTKDDRITPEEAAPEKPGGKGYGYSPAREAAKLGFTREDAKAEADQFFQQRVDKVIQDGDMEKAGRMVEARDRMRRAGALMKPAGEAAKEELPTPDTTVAPDSLRDKAEAVRKLLTAQRAQKALQRELRRVRLGQDPAATPDEVKALNRVLDDEERTEPFSVAYEAVEPDLRDQLEAAIKDAANEDLTRSFLEAIDDEDTEHPGENVRRALRAPHAAGAYAHLNNVMLATLGTDKLDRTVVDVLGVDAAAQLAANALRAHLDDDDLAGLTDSLGKHHDQVSVKTMRDAMKDAQAARAEAENIEVPDITNAEDAALAQRLLEDKRQHLENAHKALGNALGAVEAGAALNLALMRRPDHILANLGQMAVPQAALNLRALGLQDGQYEWHQDADGNLWARINSAGMAALTPERDQKEIELREAVQDIKAGRADEDDWLPANFERYSSADLGENPPLPSTYARTWQVTPDTDLATHTTELAASRLADGWSPAEVVRHLTRQDLMAQNVPDEQHDAFRKAVADLLPATDGTRLRKAKDGTTIEEPVYVDYDNLEEKHPHIHERLKQAADTWLRANHPDQPGYEQQQLPDNEQTRKALHMTLVQDPRTQAAFKQPEELDHADKRAIRSYWLSDVAGKSPEHIAEMNEATRKASEEFEQTNPRPAKWTLGGGGGLFGPAEPTEPDSITLRFSYKGSDADERRTKAIESMGLSKDAGHFVERAEDGSITLTKAGMDALRPPASQYTGDTETIHGLEALNPDYLDWNRRKREAVADKANLDDMPEWQEFLQTVGGTHHAYEAVQEHMQGAVAQRFHRYHGNVTGQALKLGRASNRYGEATLALTNPDLAKRLKELRAEQTEQARQRQGGKYAYMGGKGAAIEAVRKLREAEKAAANAQAALFGGVPTEDSSTRDDLVDGLERHDLPRGVKARLGEMMKHVGKNIDPNGNPARLIPDMTMGKGTRFVKQQRAVKALLAAKKMALFLGVGSGKTATSIGAFTELHHRGEAKRGMYVVPSIVRDQFGEEMARTLKPGAYNWHAREATYEQRLQHYKNPDTHMMAVTHQSYRDDMLRLMAEHHGAESTDAMTQRFMAADPAERKRLMQEALEGHGIPHDFLAIDEAHDALNRAGKAESALAAVLDTSMALAKYGTVMTGSPVKNDESEIHDWLKKLDPDRFGNRDEFMRKYGADVFASREALKRLTDRYIYHDVVPAQTTKSIVWGDPGKDGDTPSGHAPIALTPWQQDAIGRVDAAFQKARRARREGRVDVDAMRTLSPNSFEDAPDEEHEGIAKRLMNSLGTLKHAAHERVVNAAPPQHNAKLQHLVTLANERRGKGGVVFAHSRATVDMTKEALERAGHRVAVLTGSDNARDKARIRQALDRGAVDIVVASDAGSTGANFQGRGEWLVNMDLPMTQKTLEQRNARIDRLGQKRAIELHHLTSDTDFDRDNYSRLERKRSLGELFQGESEMMDDTGIAKYLNLARANRPPEADPNQGLLF